MPRTLLPTSQADPSFIEEGEVLDNPPYSFSYADSAERTGATGLTVADVGKFARQLDDDSLWMLVDASPVIWKNVAAAFTPYIQVQAGGVPVPSTPHTVLNFTGGVGVADAGAGVAQVTVHAKAHSIHGIDDHADAPTVSPTDGQVLKWDTATGKYVAFTPHARGHSLHAATDHTDVDATSPTDRQVLQWDSETSRWIPKVPALVVKSGGTPITGTPHIALNFIGGVTPSDAGSGVATISVHARGHSLHSDTDHTDVDGTAPTDGQVLKWDQTLGKWKATLDLSGASHERPETVFLGSLLSYPNQGGASLANEIQYTRVYLHQDTVITGGEVFLETLPGGVGTIRIGIYNQTAPASDTLDPNVKVAEITLYQLVAGDVGTFVRKSLTSNYTVPATGYYWVGFTVSSTSPKFAGSDTFRALYLPRRQASGTGTLPTTASGLSNPQSACLFVSLVRQE